jgi:hypothetical protein
VKSGPSTARDDDASAKTDEAPGRRDGEADEDEKEEKARDDKREKDERAEKEIRSRRIAVLKEKIGSLREKIQLKEGQRANFVSMRTNIDVQGINSYNTSYGTTVVGQTVGAAAGANMQTNPAGELLAVGAAAYAVISEMQSKAEQEGKVLNAREAIDQQLALLANEVSSLSAQVDQLEIELEGLITGE